jgi:phage major head subunit gpT-like protein
MEAKKSIVWQDRDAARGRAGGPANAGESFEHDVYRYRVRRRAQAGVIDSRFIYRGN